MHWVTMGYGRRATRAVALALAVVLATVATACNDSGSGSGDATGTSTPAPGIDQELEPDDPPQDGGGLVFAIPAETAGWNPAVNQWADAGNLVGSTFLEPLATFNAEGTVDPWLATAIVPEDGSDFTRWRITLRDGVQFHDGTPLTAEVVARNIEFQFNDPASLTGIALGGMLASAEAVGPREVLVTLNEPWSAFPSAMAGTAGYVMAASMLDSPNLGADAPVGTGPFVFQSWEPDRRLVVTRNDAYWREGLPHLDEIEFQVVKDGKTRKTQLETGVVDILLTNRAADIDDLASQDLTVVRDYLSENTTVMLNTIDGPFTNEHARRALAHATDRETLVAQLGADIVLTDSPLLPGTVWEVPDDQAGYLDYDPTKAAEELALYAEETGQPTLSFTFSGLANLEDQEIMQILQEQWRQAGIDASIDTLDQPSYIGKTISGTFQAAYFRNYGYPDPDNDWVFWSADTANGIGAISINFTQFTTPELEDQLTAGRSTDDVAARQAAYAEAVRLRNAAVPELWLFNTPFALVADPSVRGLNGPRTKSFANYLPQLWVADLWIER